MVKPTKMRRQHVERRRITTAGSSPLLGRRCLPNLLIMVIIIIISQQQHLSSSSSSGLVRASYLSIAQQQEQQQQSARSTNEQQAPSIIPFSFDQNVQENQRASVMCTTSSGENPVSFTWLKDGQILTPQAARRIVIKSDQDSSTLKISSVRLDHAGNYTCLARNRFGSQVHSSQLVVHGEPRWVKEPHNEPIVATRGQTIVIDCQTTGWPKPQQTWQIKSK
jgi:hypothetical protein